MQSDCVKHLLGDTEVLADQALDLDQDGVLDWAVLYINQNSGRKEDPPDPIYLLLVLSQPDGDCRVVLDDYLYSPSLTTERQRITVHVIETVELTGDDKPELHIWLDSSGGGARYSQAFHAILASEGESWTHVLGNRGIGHCLAFSTFEFRDAPTGDAKDIYLDEDRHCNPPWSSSRTYTIMRWNGSRFMRAESGTIDIQTTDPPWVDVCRLGALIGPVAFVGLVVGLLLVIVLMTRRSARG
jgi:hypothetical protein